MKLVYDQSFGATTSDFTAQVFRMKTAGVRFLIVTGDYSNYVKVLQNADQQDLKLDVFNPISNAYDPRFIQLAGPLAEKTIIYSNQVMFDGEDAAAVPEVGEFNSWLERVDTSATPDVFALYGWTACKMFVQAAIAAGPNLTRDALRAVLAGVTSFDGNGLLAQANPAAKEPPTCYLMLQVQNGAWQRRDDPDSGFRCDGEYLRA
jgi:ABC-type branched-subunit amino acid transport system substrate-binding protein